MPRQISYRWRLRELMAARGMFTVAELMPHLTERGITLSSSQVHRLVSGTPERLSLPVLATLCDILDCTPTDLITTSAQNLPARRAAGEAPSPDPGGRTGPCRLPAAASTLHQARYSSSAVSSTSSPAATAWRAALRSWCGPAGVR